MQLICISCPFEEKKKKALHCTVCVIVFIIKVEIEFQCFHV